MSWGSILGRPQRVLCSYKDKKGTRLGLYMAHRDTGMAGFLEGLM